MKKYKVKFYMDNEYEVLNTESYEIEFQGSLADCEAWIKLTERGYL